MNDFPIILFFAIYFYLYLIKTAIKKIYLFFKKMDEEQSNLTNISKRSWVWNHFTFDENTKKAQCNYCQALIAMNKGSTSGMSGHIKSQHKITKDGERQDERQGETQRSIEIAVSI